MTPRIRTEGHDGLLDPEEEKLYREQDLADYRRRSGKARSTPSSRSMLNAWLSPDGREFEFIDGHHAWAQDAEEWDDDPVAHLRPKEGTRSDRTHHTVRAMYRAGWIRRTPGGGGYQGHHSSLPKILARAREDFPNRKRVHLDLLLDQRGTDGRRWVSKVIHLDDDQPYVRNESADHLIALALLEVASSPPYHMDPEELGVLHHMGDEHVDEIDPSRLQSRDHGYYGRGFYVSSFPLRGYGRRMSKFTVKPGAKILRVPLKHEDAHPELQQAVHDHFMKHVLPKAEARGKAAEFHDEVAHWKTSPISWKDAVDRFARENEYDIDHYGQGEIVVKNPRVLTPVKRRKR